MDRFDRGGGVVTDYAALRKKFGKEWWRKIPLGDRHNPEHVGVGTWVRIRLGNGKVLWIHVREEEVVVESEEGRLVLRDSDGIKIQRKAKHSGIGDVRRRVTVGLEEGEGGP